MRLLPRLLACFVLVSFVAAQDAGEGAGDDAAASAQVSGWGLRVFVDGSASARADLDQLEGALGVWRGGVGLSASRPLAPAYTLGLGTRLETSSYEFGRATFTTGERDPFDTLWRGSVWSSLSKRREQDRIDWTGSVFANVGAEDGAELSDAVTYGFSGRLDYKYNERLTLMGGLVGTTRLEDSFLVFPIGAIDYRFNERLSVGSQGRGVGATYAFTEDVRSYFNVGFSVRQFRLDEDGILPAGVFRDDELAANVGLVWTPSRTFSAELFGGLAWRDVTFLNEDGSGLADDVEPAPFIGLRIGYGLL